jgi:hypothetical protein
MILPFFLFVVAIAIVLWIVDEILKLINPTEDKQPPYKMKDDDHRFIDWR